MTIKAGERLYLETLHVGAYFQRVYEDGGISTIFKVDRIFIEEERKPVFPEQVNCTYVKVEYSGVQTHNTYTRLSYANDMGLTPYIGDFGPFYSKSNHCIAAEKPKPLPTKVINQYLNKTPQWLAKGGEIIQELEKAGYKIVEA